MAKLVFEDAKAFIARKDSVALVTGLFAETCPYMFQEEDIYTALKSQLPMESFFLVAEDENEQIQGVASFYLVLDNFFKYPIAIEQFIYVFPKYRNSSLYLRLLKEMTRIVRQTPATQLYVGSANITPEVRERYYQMLQRIGFTEEHRSYALKLK